MNVRAFNDADAPAVAAILAAEEERLYGRPGHVTAEDILMFQRWSDQTLVWEEDGTVLASATLRAHGDAADVRAAIGPKGRGIGTDILERGEAFAREKGMQKLLAGAPEPDNDARALLELRGFREVRRFWEMVIELTEEPEVPALPDGLLLDEVRDGEERAFYDALNEAFADHWQWYPTPFEEWIEIRGGQHHDEHGPLWFVIRDGDELAAVTRNEARAVGAGYVGAIGVRPPWRGKGLAKVLLYHSFAEFWRRGMTRVTLDVDSQNETGATHLYERVGMHVDTCAVAFEKVLA